MRKLASTGFVVLGLIGASQSDPAPPPATRTEPDPRLQRLHEFFEDRESPIKELAPEFLVAADRNTLDWRLLPSIAVAESGAGKEFMNNNIFGWDSCKTRFPSVRAGIHTVADRLAQSKLYRDKDVEEILNTYNPNGDYAARVMRIMRSIEPADPVLEN